MRDKEPTLKLEVTHKDVDNLLWGLDRLTQESVYMVGWTQAADDEVKDLRKRLEVLGDTFSHAERSRK